VKNKLDFIDNYNEDSKKVKCCENGCGRLIYWNSNENVYFEVGSGQKHICADQDRFTTKSQEQILQQDINVIDTREEILAGILLRLDRLDRKLDKLGGA
jgi:hypothetical protein